MKMTYDGGVVYVNPLGLGDIRDKLATAEDTDMIVMCFGCTDKDLPDNTLYRAYNAILSIKEVDILACIAPCEFNVFNYRTHDINKFAIVIKGKMLKWFMEVKWDNLDQLILTLAYYEHKVYLKYNGGTAVKTKSLADVMTAEEVNTYETILTNFCIIVPTKNMKKAVAEMNLPIDVPVCFLIHVDDVDEEYKKECPKNYMVMKYDYDFNYSLLHNDAICDYLKGLYGSFVLCNDDVVLGENTLETLLMPFAIDKDVGLVGARLNYPDGKIQHVGVRRDRKLGALHIDRGTNNKQTDEFYTTREVTFALVALRSTAFWKIRGFDNSFAYDFNDIDFCLRLRKAGIQVLYNPNAVAVHDESRTRKQSQKTGNKKELQMFKEKHKDLLK